MNQIRFTVMDGENQVHQTPWHPESGRNDALNLLSDVRKRLGGNYAYRIERTGDSKIPNPVPQFRFKITSKNGQVPVTKLDGTTEVVGTRGATLFSRIFQEPEREKVIAEIRAMFPDAQLIEESF